MNKKLIVLIILICALSAGIIWMYKTKIADPQSAPAPDSIQETVTEDTRVVFTSYAGTYLALDKNWMVCANTSQKPKDIPEITGVKFKRLAYGKTAEPEEQSELDYVIRVALDLQKNDIHADIISYQDRMVTVTVDNLTIKLGKDDKTDDKINDLSDFIDMVYGLHGTLYMQNGNANNYGYSFRAEEDSETQ